MRVRDLIGRKPAGVVTIEPGATLEAAVKLMVRHNVGGLPVMAPDGAVTGFVAERDVVRAVYEHHGDIGTVLVAQVRRPPPMCDADDSVNAAMRRRTRERIRHLVVQDQGAIVGVLSVGDIVKNHVEQLELEAGVLRDYVIAQRAKR